MRFVDRIDFTMPGAVQLTINGAPVAMLDVDDKRLESPVQLALTTPGELVPFQSGSIPAGCAVLILPPEVAIAFRAAQAERFKRARAAAAAAQANGH